MKIREIIEAYREGSSSTLTHEGKTYRVDDIIKLASNKPIVKFDLRKLQWMVTPSSADYERVQASDKRIPIIVIEYKKNRWVTLDGFHRTSKALLDGDKTIQARILTNEDFGALK